MRTSRYTIYVDLPGNDSQILLVHGYNGAYDLVSRRVGTYLHRLEDGEPPKPLFGDWKPEHYTEGEVPKLNQETMKILERRGYLTHLTAEEEERLLMYVADTIHIQRVANTHPAYTIVPTYNCNLSCSYCFQNEMRSDTETPAMLTIMSRKMADRIFESIRGIEAGSKHPMPSQRHFSLFGGEPLLPATRDINKYLLEKAFVMGESSFTAITNGTYLHKYRDMLGPRAISKIQITLDGSKSVHDKRRSFRDGTGSFDRIVDNIKMALDLGVRVSVRINVDAGNVNNLPVLAKEITEYGWNEYTNFMVYTWPVRFYGDSKSGKTGISLWDLDKSIIDLRNNCPHMQVIVGSGDHTRQKAEQLFAGELPYMKMKASFCGAHTNMYTFDPVGDIYACWELAGTPKHRIGKVLKTGKAAMSNSALRLWRTRTVASNITCRKCRYALFCGGGCAALSVRQANTFTGTFCDAFASRFRAAVAEAFVNYKNDDSTYSSNDPEICVI